MLLLSSNNLASIASPSLVHPRKDSRVYDPGSVIMHFDPAIVAAMQAKSAEAEAENAKGNNEMDAEDYHQAELYFRRAIAIVPNDHIYLENLAYALIGQGQKRAALQLLHNLFYQKGKSLVTSGNRLKPHMIYALLCDEAGNWREAVTAYNLVYPLANDGGSMPKLALVFEVSKPEPMLLAAAIHVCLGLKDFFSLSQGNLKSLQALAQYRKALQLEPNWDVANFYYAQILRKLHRTKEAEAAFKHTLILAGNDKNVAGPAKDAL